MKLTKIAIHGVPRSGTTWLGAIFDSSPNVAYRYQPLFSYAFKSLISGKSSLEEINDFFKEILITDDEFVLQKIGKKTGIVPSFLKNNITHIIYKEVRYHNILKNLLEKDSEIKVIGLVRNPLSVLSSWLQAPKEFRKDLGWDEIKEWRWAKKKNLDKLEEFNGFEKWKEAVLLFEGLEKKYPDRFLLLQYEHLLKEPNLNVKRIFSYCGIPYSKQTQDFITESSENDQSKDAYSVFRKNQTDDKWKAQLNKTIINKIKDELKTTSLEKYLYE